MIRINRIVIRTRGLQRAQAHDLAEKVAAGIAARLQGYPGSTLKPAALEQPSSLGGIRIRLHASNCTPARLADAISHRVAEALR